MGKGLLHIYSGIRFWVLQYHLGSGCSGTHSGKRFWVLQYTYVLGAPVHLVENGSGCSSNDQISNLKSHILMHIVVCNFMYQFMDFTTNIFPPLPITFFLVILFS